MELKSMTLAVVVKSGSILLGRKKRGFGEGKWNGFGGKVHEGETALSAAARELTEESGLTAESLHKVGEIIFHNTETEHHKVEIFAVDSYTGEITESEEMEPKWFAIDAIPYAHMWEDDKFWLPVFLTGASFQGEFFFKDGTIIDYVLHTREAFV